MKTNIYIKSLGAFAVSRMIGICIIMSIFVSNTASSQISGVAFRDFNSDGKISLAYPRDTGLPGITVTAYIGDGSTSVVKTTDASGNYAFSAGEVPAGSKVRLEFTNFGDAYFESVSSSFNTTSVQFLSAPASNVNFGVLKQNDYCQAGPFFVIPCYVNGDPLQTTGDATKDAAEADVLVAFDYMAQGQMSPSNFAPLHFGYGKDMGSVWGTAYHARTKNVLNSALLRRHAGFGPLGSGGIYKTNVVTGVVSPYLDLKTLGVDTGPDPHTTLTGDKTLATADPLTYARVGKSGLGGMDLSPDGTRLYVSNLFTKKLVCIEVGKDLKTVTPADIKTYDIPNGDCPNNDYVSWAVTCDSKYVYVGVNCTGETSGLTSELKATVYRMDTAGAGAFTKVLQYPIDFLKGFTDRTGSCINSDHWNVWSNNFPAPCAANFVLNPQPILSDVYFDNGGNMNIGFMDRFGMQSGVTHPDLNGNGSYQGFTGGDLQKAALMPDGSFQIENNGKAGSLTGAGVGNNQGPGGGEFYANDGWKFFGNLAHDEVLNGGLLVIPGYDEVLSTSIDPIDEVYLSAGWQVYNATNGDLNREFAIWGYTGGPYVADGTFGKSAGLGSGKALCDAGPLEIGNRVWADADLDGIQDPDEPGIDGVEVQLCDAATGQVVGTSVTSNGGLYFFNNSNVATTATNIGLEFDKNYIIKVAKNQPVLSDYPSLSPSNAGTNDGLDSDAIPTATACEIPVKTGGIAETNHSYDFGFTSCMKVDSITISECDVWTNTYRVRVYTTYQNNPVKNIKIKIEKPTGEILKDTIITPATTASSQMALITDLVSGGLAGMKINVALLNSSGTVLCNYDSTYNAPAQCVVIDGQVIDPMGVIFCEETGEVVTGGSIKITGPGEAIVLDNGSEGIYRWYISPEFEGIYNLKYTPPAGYTLSDKCVAENDTLQLTNLPNPYIVGNEMTADGAFISSTDCTPYWTNINIRFGDPHLFYNNIPLKGCCTVKPNVGKDTTICADAGPVNFDLNNAGFNEKWSEVTGNPAGVVLDPTTGAVSNLQVPGTYRFQLVRGLESSSCRDTITIKLNTVPVAPTITGENSLCKGSSTVLTVSDCSGTVLWSDGSTGTELTVSPTATTSYTAICKLITGCQSLPSVAHLITVTDVPSAPSITAAGPTQICPSETVTLTATACIAGTLLWSNGATTASISVSVAGTYSAVCTNTCGESAESNLIEVTTKAKPAAPVLSVTESTLICPGQSVTITASACETGATLKWNTNATTATIVASAVGTYSATCTSACGESLISNIITVAENPNCCLAVPNAGLDQTLCGVSTVNLADAATGQTWSVVPGNPTLVSIDAATGVVQGMTMAGTYKFALSKASDCSDTVAIKIVNIPSINAQYSLTTCENDLMKNNGFITITGFGGTDRHAVSPGSTYTGTTQSYAAAAAIPADGIIMKNLVNPTTKTTYTIRVFTEFGCFSDKTVTLTPNTAICCTKPNAGLDQILTCVNGVAPIKVTMSATAKSGATWKQLSTNAVGANIVTSSANNTEVNGLVSGKTYGFVWGTVDCADTVMVQVPTCTPILGSIGDLVWKDANENGLQDIGEAVVNGMKIILWSADASQNPLAKLDSTATVAGQYLFDQLPQGNYLVQFVASTAPADCNGFTAANAGVDTQDSDVNPANGFSPMIALNPSLGGVNKDNYTIDAGLKPKPVLGSIGNYVWKDANSNGLQDAGETPVNGLKVILWSVGSNGAASVKLDSQLTVNGLYKFVNLPKGNYTVQFIESTGPADCDGFTYQNTGNDELDSDVNISTGFSPMVALNPALGDINQHNMTIDAGLKAAKAEISDPCSCHDIEYDPHEFFEVLDQITVTGKPNATWRIIEQTGMQKIDTLKDVNIPIGTILKEVSPGVYRLKFAHDAGVGYTVKVSNGRITLAMSNICEVSQSVTSNIPDAICPSASKLALKSTAYIKKNKVLSEAPGSFEYFTVSANHDTTYMTEFNPALYVSVDSVLLYSRFTPAQSADCPRTTVYVVKIDMSQCQQLGQIGNYVWKDTNKNGQQDVTELPVNGMKVILWSANNLGAPATKLDSMLTTNGLYKFTDLPKGNYLVQFIASTGPVDCDGFTSQNAGNDETDSDVNPVNGFSQMVSLNPELGGINQSNMTIDAGLKPKEKAVGCIGNYVWKDANKNGLQDPNELPINGMKVTLWSATTTGVLITTLATQNTVGGYYKFNNLPKGCYYVQFDVNTAPADCAGFTINNAGDDASDSDADATGLSPLLKLDPEAGGIKQNNLTVDAGLQPKDPGCIPVCVEFKVKRVK